MKLSAIVLGLTLIAGTALAQKPDSSASQTGKTASESAQASTQSAASNTERAGGAGDLKPQTFKGTLVDAACGASASASGQSSAERANSPSKTAASASTSKSEASKTEANRSDNATSSCNISGNTAQFALQTKDGRTLPFDAVGNERTKQELASRKSWTNASTAGKPIQATVDGTQSGDTLMVLSIH